MLSGLIPQKLERDYYIQFAKKWYIILEVEEYLWGIMWGSMWVHFNKKSEESNFGHNGV